LGRQPGQLRHDIFYWFVLELGLQLGCVFFTRKSFQKNFFNFFLCHLKKIDQKLIIFANVKNSYNYDYENDE